MSEPFDPYYIWLGIPPEEQPANHYQLLGLRLLESNPEVISNAVDQRVRHIRSMQTGKRMAESQKLLSEIALASSCLLDTDKKKVYDLQLKPPSPAPQPPVATAIPLMAIPLPVSPLPVAAALPLSPIPVVPSFPVAAEPAFEPVGLSGNSFSKHSRASQSNMLPKMLGLLAFFSLLSVAAFVGVRWMLGTKPAIVANNPTPMPPVPAPTPPPTVPEKPIGPAPTESPPDVNPTPPPVAVSPTDNGSKTPVTTPTAPAAVAPAIPTNLDLQLGKQINLLKEVRFYPVSGKMDFEEGVLITAGTAYDIAEFDFVPAGDYFLQLEVTRLSGKEGFTLGLDVGGKPCALGIDTFGNLPAGPRSGLELIRGALLDSGIPGSPHCHYGSVITTDKKSTLKIISTKNRLVVDIDDRRIVNWLGNPAELSRNEFTHSASGQKLALGTWHSQFEIHSFQYFPIVKHNLDSLASAPPIPSNPTSSPQPNVAASPSTLPALHPNTTLRPYKTLEELNPKLGVVNPPLNILDFVSRISASGVNAGIVLKERGAASFRKDGIHSVGFGLVPMGDYLLQIGFTPESDSAGLEVTLPLGETRCVLLLDGPSSDRPNAFVSGIKGWGSRPADQTQPEALFQGKIFMPGTPALVNLVITQRKLYMETQGKVFAVWEGDASTLTASTSTSKPNLSIKCVGRESQLNLTSLVLFPLDAHSLGASVKTETIQQMVDAHRPGSFDQVLVAMNGQRPSGPQNSPNSSGTTPPTKSPGSLGELMAPQEVPAEEALTTAREKLKEVYGERIGKAKKADEKFKLAKELLKQAATEQNLAIKYALLDAARKLALSSLEFEEALAVVDTMSKSFKLDPLTLKVEMLVTAEKSVGVTAGQQVRVANLASAAAQKALEGNRFELADTASLVATEAATKSKDADARKSTKLIRDECLAARKQWEAYTAAQKTLEATPADPAANLVVGLYRCVELDDWAAGAKSLVQGSDPKLAASLAPIIDNAAPLEQAKAWAEAANLLTDEDKLAFLRHAKTAFEQAAETLTGLDQGGAKKRADDIQTLLTAADKAGAKKPKAIVKGKSKYEPGLIARAFIGRVRNKNGTELVGVVQKFEDFTNGLNDGGLRLYPNYSPQSFTMMAVGYVVLDKEENVVFEMNQCDCEIEVTTGTKARIGSGESVTKKLSKGVHRFVLHSAEGFGQSPTFQVYIVENRKSCLFYAPTELAIELAKPLKINAGENANRTVPGILVFGK